MDSSTARRFARIEGKINLLARAIEYILALVTGFAAYFLAAPHWGEGIAGYIGFGTAIAASAILSFRISALEQLLPYED